MIYGIGAAMGWSVHDVKASSMWEFFAAWRGYVDANTPKDKAKLTDAEAEEIFDWIDGDFGGTEALSTQTYWFESGRLTPAGRVTFQAQ